MTPVALFRRYLSQSWPLPAPFRPVLPLVVAGSHASCSLAAAGRFAQCTGQPRSEFPSNRRDKGQVAAVENTDSTHPHRAEHTEGTQTENRAWVEEFLKPAALASATTKARRHDRMTVPDRYMSFQRPPNKSAPLHVLEDAFFKASVNRQEHFLLIIRSEATFSDAQQARTVHKKLVEAVNPYLRFRLLVDLRKAKGNSSNEIEKAISEVWFPTLLQFSPMAALVQTAVGRMQVTRMFKEHGSSGKAFLTAPEALRHLGLPEDHPL